MSLVIEGWHFHEGAAVCKDCGKPAHVVVTRDRIDSFDLCNDCLGNYDVANDRIAEVFSRIFSREDVD